MAAKQQPVSIIDSLRGKENRSLLANQQRNRPNSVMSISTGLASPSPAGRQHKLKQRFTVIKKLGKGTYGKVQLAINKESGQEVAIKTIKKSKIENEQDLQRVRREIQIMSSIEHPHIIHIYEVFENKDKIVLVMQYAPGGELYEYVSQAKLLEDSEARRLFRQIATAIYYCHENKICHRDLKLENILLDEKNNAKLADFGLSNVYDKRRQLRTFCGSPLYASPEIVQGLPYEGPEVDCWSLGVLLYTLVYGAMPFDGSNFKRLVKQISEGSYYEPVHKSQASPLIRRLLCADPRQRATILDICTDSWVNGLSACSTPSSPPLLSSPSEHNQQHRLGAHQNLLKVAKDMADLTPVRIDILLALAPKSPTISSHPPDRVREPLVELQTPTTATPKRGSPSSSLFDSSVLKDDQNRATSPVASYIVRDLDNSEQTPPPEVQHVPEETEEMPKTHQEQGQDQPIENAQVETFEVEVEPQAQEVVLDLANEMQSSDLTPEAEDHSSPKLDVDKIDDKPRVEVEQTDRPMPSVVDIQVTEQEPVNMELEITSETKQEDETSSTKQEEKCLDQQQEAPMSNVESEVNTTSTSGAIQSSKVEEKPKKVKKKVIVVKKRKKVVKKDKDETEAEAEAEASRKQDAKSASRKSSLDRRLSKIDIQKPGKVQIPDTFQPSDSSDSNKANEPSKAHLETRRPSALVVDVSQRLLQQGSTVNAQTSAPQLPNVRVSDKKDEYERRASLGVVYSQVVSERGKLSPSGESAGDQLTTADEGSNSQGSRTPVPESRASQVDHTSAIYDPSEMERKLAECLEKLESVVTEQASHSSKVQVGGNRSDSLETIRPDVTPVEQNSPNTNASVTQSQVEHSEDNMQTELLTRARSGSQTHILAEEASLGPAPIARSYKKMTFTKEGACVTETGKIYSTKSKDGTVRRIERKSKVTHYPPSSELSAQQRKQIEEQEEEEIVYSEGGAPDTDDGSVWQSNSRFHTSSRVSRSKSPHVGSNLDWSCLGGARSEDLDGDLFGQRNNRASPHPLGRQDSNSSCSSGSTDIFDDIFDHWTGAISMFRRSSKPRFAFPTLDDGSSSCQQLCLHVVL